MGINVYVTNLALAEVLAFSLLGVVGGTIRLVRRGDQGFHLCVTLVAVPAYASE